MATISLKMILLIHWVLVMWSTLDLLGPGYIWINMTVLAIGIWAVADRQSVDALFMFITTMIASVIFDIVFLSLYFPSSSTTVLVKSSAKFAAAMYIINLIFKPVSILFSYKMYCDRGGNINFRFGDGQGEAPPYDQIGEDRSSGHNVSSGLGGSSAPITNPFPQAYQQAPPNPPKTDLLG